MRKRWLNKVIGYDKNGNELWEYDRVVHDIMGEGEVDFDSRLMDIFIPDKPYKGRYAFDLKSESKYITKISGGVK